MYFKKNENSIQNDKIVFTYINKFAKKKTKDHLFQLRGIELLDNKVVIVFCSYVITLRRKIFKPIEIIYAISDTYCFYFEYSETNKKWEMINVKSTGV